MVLSGFYCPSVLGLLNLTLDVSASPARPFVKTAHLYILDKPCLQTALHLMAEQAPARGLGRTLLVLGGAILAHAGYSIYELQVVLRESGGHFSPLRTTATPEAFLGLLIIICGVSLTATPFKEIAWEAEMRKKTLSEMSFKPGFLNLQQSRAIPSAKDVVPDSSTPQTKAVVTEDGHEEKIDA